MITVPIALLSGKAERINRTPKFKIPKVDETTGLPWLMVLSLALLTIDRSPLRKHKLTPHETVTADPRWSVYNFLLIFCYSLWVSPATWNLQCAMLKPIINRLEKPSQIPIQRILLVTELCLMTGHSRTGITGNQSLERTPPSAPDHWHHCKTRRHWALGTSHS